MANKIVAIPISWMLYELPENVFAVLGAAVTTPPIVVLEAMVEQGLARHVKVISEGILEEVEEEPTEEKTDGESPWFPRG